jgi:uncharacterized protein (TIGR03437 family)
MTPIAGGILSPASFLVSGKQYAAAVHSNGSFVSNGSVPNVPAAPALPGETVVFYGIGFGGVTPAISPGQVAQGQTSVATPVQFFFGDLSARVDYAGLAPGYVGLYQFNVVVPSGTPSGDVPLRIVSGTDPIQQSLYLTVRGQ